MNKRFLPVFFLLLASLACNFVAGSTPTPVSNVLFQDDFSNPDSGWDRVTQETGQTDYLDGAYRVWVNQVNTDVWANPGLSFEDVQIEVDAAPVGGSENNDFGVTCRVVDSQNFYFLVISSDGYYGIGKLTNGTQSLLGMDAMQSSDQIAIGKDSYHIRADCIGTTLTLWVDGQQVAQAEDNQFSAGDVGLIAGSFDTPGTDVHFDNFSVLKP